MTKPGGAGLKKCLLFALVFLVSIYSLFPFYWAVISSLKTHAEIFLPELWPKNITFSHYPEVFQGQNFGANIWNSFGIALLCVSLSLGLGVPASYVLGRRSFQGRKAVLLSFLLVSTFPQIAVLGGLFELIRALGLFNRWGALILSDLIFTLPFVIWNLQIFMKQFPRSLEEAAVLDGAGLGTLLTRIFIPILLPQMVSVILLAMISVWNEFLFALTFTLTDRARTVPVGLAFMSGASVHEIPWALIMAGSVTVTLPVILVVWLLQKRIVAGLTSGAIK